MAGEGILSGLLNIKDSTRVKLNTVNVEFVMDALSEVVEFHNSQLDLMTDVFVESTTDKPQMKYFPRFRDTMVPEAEGAQKIASKVGGEYTVGFPLYGYTNTKMFTDIDYNYMTVADLDRQVTAVLDANVHQVKVDILTALFRGADLIFDDPIQGNITVKPLASGAADGVVYPPVIGGTAPATHSHLLNVSYATSAISTTNDIVATMINHLEEHYGYTNQGEDIIIMGGTAFCDKVEDVYTAAGTFVPVVDRYIQVGLSSDTVSSVLSGVPGKVRGRLTKGAWLVEWREIPAEYAYGQHLSMGAPLYRRLDAADANIPSGLHPLTSELAKNPLLDMTWRNRFGYGIANRLGAVVVELNEATAYAAPTFS